MRKILLFNCFFIWYCTLYAESYNNSLFLPTKNSSEEIFINNSQYDKNYKLVNNYNMNGDAYNNYDKGKYFKVSNYFLGAFLVTGLITLYSLPNSVTGWEKSDLFTDIKHADQTWYQHVKNGPKWDKDPSGFNYVAHPYVGAIYYMQARKSGFNRHQSFLYAGFISTFVWEFGLEAFSQVPSVQDLIITPVVGSFLGEGFYIYSNHIKNNNKEVLGSRFLGNTLLTVMDPIGQIIDNTFLCNHVAKTKDGSYNTYTNFYVKNNTTGIDFIINLR